MTPLTRPRFLAYLLVLLIGVIASFGPVLRAQDAKQDVGKQKAAVAENLKKAELGKTTIVETDHFLIATTLPEDRAKILGAVLERIVPIARKGLQYESKEEAWKGKLAVYYLPEGRDFKSFIRNVVIARPEGVHYDLRADNPFLVDPGEVAGKATEADQFANAAAIVAAAYLKAKGSTANVPDWLRDGFGRVTALRAEGLTSKKYATYKAQAKTVATGAKSGKAAAIADLWAETKPASSEVLSASLAEYLAYGPGSPNFIKLVYGFRPDENGNVPSAPQAFEAAGWKEIPMLEKAWQKWAVTGK